MCWSFVSNALTSFAAALSKEGCEIVEGSWAWALQNDEDSMAKHNPPIELPFRGVYTVPYWHTMTHPLAHKKNEWPYLDHSGQEWNNDFLRGYNTSRKLFIVRPWNPSKMLGYAAVSLPSSLSILSINQKNRSPTLQTSPIFLENHSLSTKHTKPPDHEAPTFFHGLFHGCPTWVCRPSRISLLRETWDHASDPDTREGTKEPAAKPKKTKSTVWWSCSLFLSLLLIFINH